MRSLDPYHARIGYLGALATVATRDLDRVEALAARFHDLLFERIYPDDPRFDALMARVAEGRRDELRRKMNRPPDEDPSAILSAPDRQSGWLSVSEFWLHDRCMPSHLGHLPVEKRDRTIDLARWTGMLQATLELSEAGYLLHRLLLDAARNSEELAPFNLLNPWARPCLPLLYLRLLLGAELLFPFLVGELVSRHEDSQPLATSGENGLLRAAVTRMLDRIGEPTDPEDILAVRDVVEFRKSIENKRSTEENYLRPRLEILVDLGFVGRRSDRKGKRSDFMWTVTDTTRALTAEWKTLEAPTNVIPVYLDREFFGSMARVFSLSHRHPARDDERLLWFARAYHLVGREFGFTPGRTLALLGCLMAWEAGVVFEVADVFDAVYRAAGTPWERFLHFSGGSRFDREFLIRIDDDALSALESAAGKVGERP
jgi:hypothetical protein